MNWCAFWQRIKAITYKEFLATFKDPKARVLLLIPVFVQGLLFGYAATYDLKDVPYAIVDMSHSQSGTNLLANISSVDIFKPTLVLHSPKEVADAIDDGQVIMAVVIPEDFEEKLMRRQASPIQVITDGKNSNTAGRVNGYINRIVQAYNAELGHSSLVEVQYRNWYNPNQLTRWTFLPGLIGLISMTQVILLGGLSIAREREVGTFDQLLVTPASSAEILIGKSVPPMLIGLFQSTVMFCLARFWFEVPFLGNILLLYLSLFIFILSAIGIGLSISSIAKNMQQVLVYVFVLLLPLALLSGLATPVRNMPEILQVITYVNPLRFALECIRRVYLEGAGFMDIAHNFIPMLVVAAITLPLAAWLFRNKAV